MTAEDYGLARRMWHQLEPVHALFWYAPEVFAEAAVLGYEVTTRWPSYFAWRLAPLGAVGPRLAASACYSFSPAMVTAHVPAAWAVASPPQILAARERAADRMYRALPGGLIDSPGLAEAADLARQAALAADTAGRPLAAANADLPWPGEPHLVLWHAINVLREQRGDGHRRASGGRAGPVRGAGVVRGDRCRTGGCLRQPRMEHSRMVRGPGPADRPRVDRCGGHGNRARPAGPGRDRMAHRPAGRRPMAGAGR
jgi:hypothetical protein